ncbi:response regulator [candidate division KSB3 bacterium]|uniref:Response regulator n=1 Tax=candidate division KSB3 bacterium TaxID=2044937 RepID=A0A9D5Q520_9BACT|nr:response regulator [candidate division KSB3 bacterium]MBD3324344.1 response regulator [candidate division KSB3 bacterium]
MAWPEIKLTPRRKDGVRCMKSQRILIADDDEKVLMLLASSLQKAGYVTMKAKNGMIALEQAKHERPDLILADITMPEMDGFELCTRIREDPTTADIPFIFLTAKGELGDRVAGLNLGADDYISKPFHISEVTARIKTILQRTAFSGPTDTAEEGEMDLRGNLEQMHLAEIIQTLSMNQKSGGLKITRGSQVGKIGFEQGSIVHASLDSYTGEEAIYRILAWDDGYFVFDSTDPPDTKTITASINGLLMDGLNQREEYLKYKKVLPSFDAVLTIPDPEKTKGVKPTVKKILSLIDGQRTIQQIIEVSPMNYVLATKIIYTLLKKDFIQADANAETQDKRPEDYSQLAQELYE